MSTISNTSSTPDAPVKVDPATLTAPKRTPLVETNDNIAVHTTTSQTDPLKGGKGGERGEPALPPSNAQFLASVVRDVAGDARAVVCSKPGDPANGGWVATVATDADQQCPPDRNNYFNCSSFIVDDQGEASD